MSVSRWWHPTDDDDWDEPLPPVVTLEPDYHAKLPLGGEGELAWQRTKFTPELLDRLAAWQEEFETNFHVQGGWRAQDAKERWAIEAEDLAVKVRAELGNRAELFVNLWPLQDDNG